MIRLIWLSQCVQGEGNPRPLDLLQFVGNPSVTNTIRRYVVDQLKKTLP